MPSADARACAELREALNVWDLAKSIEYGNPGLWVEELELLNRELMRDRDIWIDSNLSAINRYIKFFIFIAYKSIKNIVLNQNVC